MSTLAISNSAKQSMPHTLTAASSFLLDFIRLSAAMLVVVAHSGHPEFHTGFQNRQILGDIAVPIFFVLSGFVIRFITRSREHTPREFFIDRASRIYSVVLPAMILTLVASALCYKLAPHYYLENWAGTSNHPLPRIALNLFFLSQIWGHNTIPFVNSPFWSLGYECLYYVVYGLFFYLRGSYRVLALLLWAALAGPQVILLLPIWYFGCWAYDLYHAVRQTPVARFLGKATLVFVVLAIALRALGSDALINAPLRADLAFSQLPNPLELLRTPAMRATMLAIGTGVMAVIAMLLLLLLSDLVPLAHNNVWVRRFRHLADGTFSIYLMHYPLMVLATALGLLRPRSLIVNLITLTVISLVLISLARPLDLLKFALRARLRHILA